MVRSDLRLCDLHFFASLLLLHSPRHSPTRSSHPASCTSILDKHDRVYVFQPCCHPISRAVHGSAAKSGCFRSSPLASCHAERSLYSARAAQSRRASAWPWHCCPQLHPPTAGDCSRVPGAIHGCRASLNALGGPDMRPCIASPLTHAGVAMEARMTVAREGARPRTTTQSCASRL